MAPGLYGTRGTSVNLGEETRGGPTRAGGTDGNWKGRKRMQMTSSEMKVGLSLVTRERVFITCGLVLPCGLWNSRKEVLSWSDQLSVRRKENDALAMEGLEPILGGCENSA